MSKRIGRAISVLGVMLAAGGAAFAAPILIVLERRFPVNLYCPIDNDDFDLTFVAEGPQVRLTFAGNNEFEGNWLHRRLDNIAVVAKLTYDANKVVTPGFGACYEAPGSPDTPAYNFAAAGTTEVFLDLFDTEADGWDLNLGGYFQPGPGVSAPRNPDPASPSDATLGALGLGRQTDGTANVSTTVLISGLTTGVQYIVTGWWYIEQFLQPMTVTIDPSPCLDRDLDGVGECTDCDDRNAKRKPGLAEVCDGYDNDCDGVVYESTPCDRVCDVPEKVGGTDLRITNAEFTSTNPSIVWNGTDYAMFYKDSRNGGQELFFSRVSVAGVKIGTDLNLDPGSQSEEPRAVWTGSEYGVVWNLNGLVGFRRFDRNGSPIGAAVTIGASSPGAFSPDIAWSGTEYGITWAQFVLTPEIFFTRFAADGTSLMLNPVQLSAGSSPQYPRIAWNGAHYGVTWQGHDGVQTIYFRRVTPLDPATGSPIKLSPAVGGSGSFAPAIASGGGEWGVAWADYRNGFDTEIYFARVAATGLEVGAEVRVTNATGASFYAEVAWSGSEWGLVWEDYRSGDSEQWFGRVSAAGVKLGTDFRVTNAAGSSQQGALVWAGGKYAIAWNDDRNSGDQEIYFARVGCDCIDSDLDGQSSCVDCDDGRAATFPGASQVCDGFNNNCTDVNWPLLAGTNEFDGDGDTFTSCTGDCNDANGAVWATPGEARFVLMSHDKLNGVTNVSWSAPTAPGGTSLVYDTVRSNTASNFVTGATCVETNNGPNTVATDTANPGSGAYFAYLIRGENACPSGQGSLGTSSAGVPRTARTCP